ncbi:MAG: hypothetical protein JXA99_04660 [Candidatus Lokiarchaeota archaeon]|nr:hypothetical protein [Candidatus Lokiarchaeota archaeon]
MSKRLKLDMVMVNLSNIISEDRLREGIRKPDKLIIADGFIFIPFIYQINWIKKFKAIGGFTKMELYKCIYEGHKEMEKEGIIYNLELLSIWIEGVYYYRKEHLVLLQVGT